MMISDDDSCNDIKKLIIKVSVEFLKIAIYVN